VTINSARFFLIRRISRGFFAVRLKSQFILYQASFLSFSVFLARVVCLQLDEAEFHGKSEWKNTGAQVNVVLHAD